MSYRSSSVNRYQYIADAANRMYLLRKEGPSKEEGYIQILMIAYETLLRIENDPTFFEDVNARNVFGLPSNTASKTRSYFRHFLDTERSMLIREVSLDSKLAREIIALIERSIEHPTVVVNSVELHATVCLLRGYVQHQLNLLEEKLVTRKRIRKRVRKIVYGMGGLTMVAANASIAPFPILGPSAAPLSISIGGAFLGASFPSE